MTIAFIILAALAALAGYVTVAAFTFRRMYEDEYERVLSEYSQPDRYHAHAHSMAMFKVMPAIFWPLTLPFELARPVPPSLAKARQDAKWRREEAEIQELERQAGIR